MKIHMTVTDKALYEGNKIAAIKIARFHFGFSLKEAKDSIEACEVGEPELEFPGAGGSLETLVKEFSAIGIRATVPSFGSDIRFIQEVLHRAIDDRRWRVASGLVEIARAL